MAYDAELDRVILFGGVTGNPQSADYTAPDDTWAYEVTATRWTPMKPPSPSHPL
jgi:hypothetical protein